jgi:hypothetical protein
MVLPFWNYMSDVLHIIYIIYFVLWSF